MPNATVSPRGAILIPAEYRRKYGLRPGDRVSFVDYGGRLQIIPVPRDPIPTLMGFSSGGRRSPARCSGNAERSVAVRTGRSPSTVVDHFS
ncbi:MAG: AbrB/MazE/SpoVT family DNA-binding domain-containing protein [Planctomycetes bacterium]|nr:AbrB/MazE/SpoVT family DNA-binding domain-containing protein [Planctomycetota bacterium]